MSFPKNLQSLGDPGHRPICIEDVPPVGEILQLDAGPSKPGHRRTETKLELQPALCFSALLPGRTSLKAGEATSHYHDHNYASVAVPNMVPITTRNVNQTAFIAEPLTRPPKKPQERVSLPNTEWNNEVGSLARVRERISTKKISDTDLAYRQGQIRRNKI